MGVDKITLGNPADPGDEAKRERQAERERPGPSRRGLLMAGLAAASIRKPGSLPYPKLPEGKDTMPLVRHIVVLMMENHSYDNKLGMLQRPGADGFNDVVDGAVGGDHDDWKLRIALVNLGQ